jgi:integrative and conjugative element protein (TIGR02256 family)
MFALPTTIFLTARSYRDILNETSQQLATETGGVLIGECRRDKWFVVESIDPGPKAVLQHSYFEYDHNYVNHLTNKVRQRYVAPLKLLGLWHRHPGSFDRFSGTDDGTHRRYIQQCNGRIISGLVNVDPTFRITFYVVDGEPPRHQRTGYVVGDEHFPPELLLTLDERTLLGRVNNVPGMRPKPAQEIRIIDKHQSSSSVLDDIVNPIRGLFGAQSSTVEPSDQRLVPPGTVDPVAAEALEMLDEELEYLDSQREFEYELELSTRGVLLTMQKLVRLQGTVDHVRFLFTVEDQRRILKYGNQSYPFRKGIVEEVIGLMFY